MRRVVSVVCLALLAACIDAVPIAQNANMTCWYGNRVVFTGRLTLEGDGLDRFPAEGTWGLCGARDADVVKCEVTLTSSTS